MTQYLTCSSFFLKSFPVRSIIQMCDQLSRVTDLSLQKCYRSQNKWTSTLSAEFTIMFKRSPLSLNNTLAKQHVRHISLFGLSFTWLQHPKWNKAMQQMHWHCRVTNGTLSTVFPKVPPLTGVVVHFAEIKDVTWKMIHCLQSMEYAAKYLLIWNSGISTSSYANRHYCNHS